MNIKHDLSSDELLNLESTLEESFDQLKKDIIDYIEGVREGETVTEIEYKTHIKLQHVPDAIFLVTTSSDVQLWVIIGELPTIAYPLDIFSDFTLEKLYTYHVGLTTRDRYKREEESSRRERGYL